MTDRRYELAPEPDPYDFARGVTCAVACLALISAACAVQAYVDVKIDSTGTEKKSPVRPNEIPSGEFVSVSPVEFAAFITPSPIQ